jgi:hypothetical protein
MPLADTLTRIREVTSAMLTEAHLAEEGKHGHKAAHKRMRAHSNELSKLLPQLRKDSISATGSTATETTTEE